MAAIVCCQPEQADLPPWLLNIAFQIEAIYPAAVDDLFMRFCIYKHASEYGFDRKRIVVEVIQLLWATGSPAGYQNDRLIRAVVNIDGISIHGSDYHRAG